MIKDRSFEGLSKKCEKFMQTEILITNSESQTDYNNEVESRISELQELHNNELQDIEEKITQTLQKKNGYIRGLESQVQQLVIKNKELEALFKQLRT